MKTLQIKFPVLLLVLSFLTVLGLSNCGQNENTKKDNVVTEPVKKEAETPAVTIDSQVAVPVNPVSIEKPVNIQAEVKTDTKKEIIPADKTKVPEPDKKPTVVQPVVINNKPAPNTNVTPPNDKPIAKPVETPIVKVTEPIKPKPDTVSKPVVVTKPVVVVKPQPEQDTWIVPAKYKNMTSPFAVNKEAFDLGRTVYGTHCKSCHGAKGDGNGPKAAQLDTKMGSFLSADFLAQKPGEVYYKVTIGRKDMPKYEKKIPDDEERWAVVYYIMNLKK